MSAGRAPLTPDPAGEGAYPAPPAGPGTRFCDWCVRNAGTLRKRNFWACSDACYALLYGSAIGAGRLGIPVRDYRRHVKAGEKWCHACRRWHMRELFGVRRSTKDGLNHVCRASETARVIAYHRRTGRNWRETA